MSLTRGVARRGEGWLPSRNFREFFVPSALSQKFLCGILWILCQEIGPCLMPTSLCKDCEHEKCSSIVIFILRRISPNCRYVSKFHCSRDFSNICGMQYKHNPRFFSPSHLIYWEQLKVLALKTTSRVSYFFLFVDLQW